jgi:hypothetical protein
MEIVFLKTGLIAADEWPGADGELRSQYSQLDSK